jgi:hypothetical protein
MTLAEIHHRQAREEVEIGLALSIPETTPLTPHKGDRKASVRRAQIFVIQIDNLLVCHVCRVPSSRLISRYLSQWKNLGEEFI